MTLMMNMTRLFLTLVFTLVILQSQAQPELDCTDCPAIEVSYTDLSVELTREEALEMGFNDQQYDALQQVTTGLFDALMEGPSDTSCILFKADAPYQFAGTLAKRSRKTLLVRAWVEIGHSGEKVVEAEQEYDLSLPAYDNGVSVARQMASLVERIRAYEQGMRDRYPGMALGFGADTSRQVWMAFDRDSLMVNQSADLNVMVNDCDGIPLEGMQLRMSVTRGQIQPAEIVTNAEGKAVVRYTAPCEPGDYEVEVAVGYDRPFEETDKQADPGNTFSTRYAFEVRPGRNLWLHYEHVASQSQGGEFTINSNGKGVIACTIERVPDSVKVTGTGMVVVDWSSNIQACIYNGRNNYRVNCFGLVVEGEEGSRWLEITRTQQDVMGGKFTMDCSGEKQEVDSPFPVPDHETGRPLRFELIDGAVNTYVDPETGSEYRYVLDLGCGK